MALTINKNLMSVNHTARKRSKADIQWIVIHYVGALGDAKANTDYYKSGYVGASADFWIGFAGDIWQGNDYYNYYSWHCGGGLQGSGGATYHGICLNSNSVGIEMCVRKKSTKTMLATDRDWYFEQATVDSAVELAKRLMEELDIDADHVIRHYDVTGKICPNPYVYDEQAWQAFKARLTASPAEKKTYVVQCGAFSKKANATAYAAQIKAAEVTDKIWMGWTVRESGKAGFRQVGGDGGKAYGKYQFDYRYALVPFLNECIKYNPDRYAGFGTFAKMKQGDSGLIGNGYLAEQWTFCCDHYAEEFEMLQDRYAYIWYYSEVKRILLEKTGINLDDRSPAVKGSMFSMSIRSGAQSAAAKIAACTAKTSDTELLRIAYGSYGTQDASRWLMIGQYGDALEAFKAGTYATLNTGVSCGFEAIVKKSGKNYLVQAGNFSVKANAEKLVARLKAAGFDAIVK